MKNSENELRQVLVKQGKISDGFFHGWCKEPFYNEDGPFITKTYALVELSNGAVELFEPSIIRFKNPYGGTKSGNLNESTNSSIKGNL
jgi:hypothetical protein